MQNENMIGKDIYINIGTATAHCAIAVSGICGTVTNQTEKAIKIAAWNDRGTRMIEAWFPKKALVGHREMETGAHHYRLAKWFKPVGWTSRFIEICQQHSSIAA